MRLPLLTLAAIAALAPPTARGEDAGAPKSRLEAAVEQREGASKEEAVAERPAPREMTEPAAIEQAARAEGDARAAMESRLSVPESSVREGEEARASLVALRGMRAAGMPRLGLAVGGGFPDFATASLVYRPVSHVRLSAGPAWNYAGWGLQGGVTFAPWNFFLVPLVSVEAGRFFRTSLGSLAKGVPQEVKPLLENIDYSYAALDVGLEVGSQRGFSGSLRVGLSYVSIAAHGTATHTSDDGTVVSMTNPAIHGTLPSLKLGFQYWF